MSRAIRIAVPLMVLCVATGMRVAHACKFPLDNDEIAEVSWSEKPWSGMMDLVKHDKVHPPPSIT